MGASNYPAGYDTLVDPTGADPLDSLTVPHADQHADVNSAVEAIQATLGTNPQGSFTTLLGRVEAANDDAAVLLVAAGEIDADKAAAAASAGTATTQAGVATEQAVIATTQAGIATTQAVIATTKASEASDSAIAAADILDQFDDRFLGPKAVAPLVDNDGNALAAGALYFDTVVSTMLVWTGVAWINASDAVSFTAPLVISGNTTDPILRLTQLGAGDVLRVEDSTNPDATPFVIDGTGAVTTAGQVSAGRFVGSGAIVIATSATRPATPSEGDTIYETDSDKFYGWTGAAWEPLGGGGAIYQTAEPVTAIQVGSLWVDSDDPASGLNSNDFLLKADATALYLSLVTAAATYATKAELDTAGSSPFFT